jgi:Xaa-Pro aminopeptidase
MRLQKFRHYMAAEELAGFLVTQPHNRRYLSGFTGSAGVLFITRDRQALATDSRYYEQVRQECPEWELVEAGYKFAQKLPDLLDELGLAGCRVGFEAGHVSVATLADWQESLLDRVELAPARNAVEELRVYKDEAELASLRQAIALADAALVHIMDWIEPGKTEQQVAWELESMMRTHGASAVSFEPIVASGPNSAKPHARPGDRRIQPGEPVTLDFGCIVGGYCSDLTRTFCLGEPAEDRYLAIWNTVLAAQQAALTGARAGKTGAEIDGLAREVIDQAGYGGYFGHSLGHGVGLAIHEEPRFSFTNSDPIPAGSVVTVEPGIYLPGWGGVRIEDVVVVGEDGLEVLSTAPKEAILV